MSQEIGVDWIGMIMFERHEKTAAHLHEFSIAPLSGINTKAK
jgi:hypothetical protein